MDLNDYRLTSWLQSFYDKLLGSALQYRTDKKIAWLQSNDTCPHHNPILWSFVLSQPLVQAAQQSQQDEIVSVVQWLGGPPVSPTPSINGCNDTSGPLDIAHTGDRRQPDVATLRPNCDNELGGGQF